MIDVTPFSDLSRVAVLGRPRSSADPAEQHRHYRRAIALHGHLGAGLVPVHPDRGVLSHYAAAPVDIACREATLLLVLDPTDPDLDSALDHAVTRAPNLPVWVESEALPEPWSDRLLEHGVPLASGGLYECLAHARGTGPDPAEVAALLAGERTPLLAEGDLSLWRTLFTQASFGPRQMPSLLLESWLARCPDVRAWLQLWDHAADRTGYGSLEIARGKAGWLGLTLRAHADPSVYAMWTLHEALSRGRPIDRPWFADTVVPARRTLEQTRLVGGWNHLRALAELCDATWYHGRPEIAAAESREAIALAEACGPLPAGLPGGRSLQELLAGAHEVIDATPEPVPARPVMDDRDGADADLVAAVRLLEEGHWVEAWQKVQPFHLEQALFGGRARTPQEQARWVAALRIEGAAAIGANAIQAGLAILESVADAPAVQVVEQRLPPVGDARMRAFGEVVWQAHAATPGDPAWVAALERLAAELEAAGELRGRMPLHRAIERARVRILANPPMLRAAERFVTRLLLEGGLELEPGTPGVVCQEAVLAALEAGGSTDDAAERVSAALIELEGVVDLYADDATIVQLLGACGLVRARG